MGKYCIDEAYDKLMSATPYSQSTGGAMLRNFGAAAQLMAAHLRATGASASDAGDAGAAAQEQAERHAAWFDQVATSSSDAAGKLDALATTGNTHQATAQEIYSSYQQAVERDSGPNASGWDDKSVIVQGANGSTTLSAAVEDWGSAYAGFNMPAPPPVHSNGGSRGSTSGSTSTGGHYDSGSTGISTSSATGQALTGTTIDRGPGGP